MSDIRPVLATAVVERLDQRVRELETLIAHLVVGMEPEPDGFGYRAKHSLQAADAARRVADDWIRRQSVVASPAAGGKAQQ